MGNILSAILAGLILYLTLEHPIQTILQKTVLNNLKLKYHFINKDG